MTATPKMQEAADLRTLERKWTKPLVDAGWTVFPNVFFEYQHALGLDPIDINILLHIAAHWWKPEEKPWPAKGTIAEAIGVHPRTVQRRIAALEKAGFIRRQERKGHRNGNQSNIYHFDGLIEAALPFAAEKLAEINQKKLEKKARASRRGRPNFKVVPNNRDDQ